MHTNQQYQTNSTLPATGITTGGIVAMGLVGAVVSATAAAAHDVRHVKAGVKTKSEAATHVAKEALGSGLALAAGAAVGRTVFRSGFLSLAAMLAVGVGVKYAYDSVVYEGQCCCSGSKEEKAPAKTAKKA